MRHRYKLVWDVAFDKRATASGEISVEDHPLAELRKLAKEHGTSIEECTHASIAPIEPAARARPIPWPAIAIVFSWALLMGALFVIAAVQS